MPAEPVRKDQVGAQVTGQITAVSSGTAFVIPAKAKNPNAGCAWANAINSEGSWMAQQMLE